jgi:hypothetical protein
LPFVYVEIQSQALSHFLRATVIDTVALADFDLLRDTTTNIHNLTLFEHPYMSHSPAAL